jgi:hypothetical protein
VPASSRPSHVGRTSPPTSASPGCTGSIRCRSCMYPFRTWHGQVASDDLTHDGETKERRPIHLMRPLPLLRSSARVIGLYQAPVRYPVPPAGAPRLISGERSCVPPCLAIGLISRPFSRACRVVIPTMIRISSGIARYRVMSIFDLPRRHQRPVGDPQGCPRERASAKPTSTSR